MYSFELPASPSHGQFPLAKFWCKLLANCQVMFATSHLWCSLPSRIHCPLACSVAKESQPSFHLCGERFSFVEDNEKFVYQKIGQVVTFHLFLVLVGALNIFSELIHPFLKLPNRVFKQQLHILQLSEALGSAFSLFEKQGQALSAYCHFHPLIFDLPENNTLYTETTLKTAFAIPSRNQSPDVSNLQRGRSCE